MNYNDILLYKADQVFTVKFFNLVKDKLYSIHGKQITEENFLNKSCTLYKAQQIWYLYYISVLIKLDLESIKDYNISQGIDAKWSFFVSKYDIFQVSSVSKCLYIDYVNDIIKELFTLNPQQDIISL